MIAKASVRDYILALGEFIYDPQVGNLGDLLIAEGTRQLFAELGVRYREYDAHHLPERFNLVFGGSGGLTSYWCDIPARIRMLTDPRIEKCLILPSSIHRVDELLLALDKRHTIICRERFSYDYCRSVLSARQADVAVLLADDMALGLDLSRLHSNHDNPDVVPQGEEAVRAYSWLKQGLYRWMSRGVRRASSVMDNGKTVAFLLRTDKERLVHLKSPLSYDISVVWNCSGKEMPYNGDLLTAFSSALCQADVIVSDRLHVCIMAFLSGREVYMIDNEYRKLSGVYELSLAEYPAVHFLPDGRLTPELQKAWKHLHSFRHSGLAYLQLWLKAVRRRVGKLFRK